MSQAVAVREKTATYQPGRSKQFPDFNAEAGQLAKQLLCTPPAFTAQVRGALKRLRSDLNSHYVVESIIKSKYSVIEIVDSLFSKKHVELYDEPVTKQVEPEDFNDTLVREQLHFLRGFLAHPARREALTHLCPTHIHLGHHCTDGQLLFPVDHVLTDFSHASYWSLTGDGRLNLSCPLF